MGEPVESLDNFEIDPYFMCIRGEIIFIYKLLWSVFKADSEKLWSIHRRGQVKIADVKSNKACMAAGEEAADYKFDKFERSCRCANFPWVAYVVSSNGDTRSVGILFLGPILAHNFGVLDIVTAVVGDIFVSDDPESISSLDALLFGGFRALTYAVAQASQFIGILLVPSLLVFGVGS